MRNVVASVANALIAGPRPMNIAEHTTPVSPITAASGTCASIRSHITTNAIVTARPTLRPVQRATVAKS